MHHFLGVKHRKPAVPQIAAVWPDKLEEDRMRVILCPCLCLPRLAKSNPCMALPFRQAACEASTCQHCINSCGRDELCCKCTCTGCGVRMRQRE